MLYEILKSSMRNPFNKLWQHTFKLNSLHEVEFLGNIYILKIKRLIKVYLILFSLNGSAEIETILLMQKSQNGIVASSQSNLPHRVGHDS